MSFIPRFQRKREIVAQRNNIETTAPCPFCDRPALARKPIAVYAKGTKAAVCDQCAEQFGAAQLRLSLQSHKPDKVARSGEEYQTVYDNAIKSGDIAVAGKMKSEAAKNGIRLKAVAQHR